jgi:hypothetical protein
MLMYEEPLVRSMCPVANFVAMALADGVFDGCETFQDIEAKKIPMGSKLYRFRYRPNVTHLPVLRSTCSDGVTSQERILTYNCLNNSLKGLGQRAGYQENLSAYCFRRAYARAIESRLKFAAVDHMSLLTIL